LFFSWIYNKKLYNNLLEERSIPLGFRRLFGLYVLSDKLGVPELGNAAVDLIYQLSAQTWGYYDVTCGLGVLIPEYHARL
jgi:hypothetical protein